MGHEVNGWIVVVNASVKRKLSLKAKLLHPDCEEESPERTQNMLEVLHVPPGSASLFNTKMLREVVGEKDVCGVG
ncbi:Hypothetical protein SMAX5B_008866 [Scophthalmus maximus]|uniref:Uncharacterized protein n=1 Tax=Scophthalmus maximus TaxID=52904 RepID=A0A2U9CB10_SCOMX|nr:Hypothetical protein SMAX5B_008866 [Scophthalmus maximus]